MRSEAIPQSLGCPDDPREGSSLIDDRGPASATMNSNCHLSVSTPVTDGVTVYSISHATCYTYMGETVSMVENLIQEYVSLVPVNATGWKRKWSAGITDFKVKKGYTCNGTGYQRWRGHGGGQTTDAGVTLAYGSPIWLTCS
jgi:hypothetical protein